MSRILFFTSQYEGIFGSTRSMIQLVKTLNDESENHCVVLTTGQGKLGGLLQQEGIAFDIIPIGRFSNMTSGKLSGHGLSGKIRAIIEIVRFQIKTYLYIRKNRFDIVYANNPGSFARIQGAALFNRTKTITYIRSAVSNDAVTRLTLKNSHRVITIADGLLKSISKNIIIKNQDRIQTIYTGFDFDSFDYTTQIDGMANEKVKIGYVASLTSRKGIDFLINLLVDSPELIRKVQLVIVGDYSHGHESFRHIMVHLLKNMDETGLEYINLGFQDNVHAVYNSIDVLALPSLSEGLPRVVIEAMAHRCVVIANDVGGTAQIIDNGINGFLEAPKDSLGWRTDLDRLVNDPEIRTELGEKAYLDVRERFSLTRFRKELSSVFT